MTVKDLRVVQIDSKSANDFVRRYHYSGKIVNNSRVHFGVMRDGVLKGAMSFGCPMDKIRAIRLVSGTKWGGMLELNRMAFAPELPKNAESRCLAVALRLIKKDAPHVQWVQTFADACQCGDGTIYRAVGFLLVGIKRNSSLRRLNDGRVVAKKTLDDHRVNGKYLSAILKTEPLDGYQIKYVYFLDPAKRQDLTCPVLPYDAIEKAGARMYLGKRVVSSKGEQPAIQLEEGGAVPTTTLQSATRNKPFECKINGELYLG